ncbi:MAG: hypothetical protein CMK07_13970 [Ponticaulis sp.]|nr:hypothetical protein [Ponticaulis sp.]
MRVFLHIGAPRTGTSSLQQLLHDNRTKLRSMGFHYPRVGYLDPKQGNAQHGLAFCLLETYPAFVDEKHRPPKDRIWPLLREHLDSIDDDIILSSEAFSSVTPESVKFILDFFKDDELEVIYIARDSDSWHKSMGKQQIKQFPFKTNPPSGYKGNINFVENKHLEHWRKNKANLTVMTYSRDVSDRFLRHIGVDHEQLTPIESLNSSLPDSVLELLMSLNGIQMPIHTRSHLNRNVETWWFNHSGDNAQDKSKDQIVEEFMTQIANVPLNEDVFNKVHETVKEWVAEQA